MIGSRIGRNGFSIIPSSSEGGLRCKAAPIDGSSRRTPSRVAVLLAMASIAGVARAGAEGVLVAHVKNGPAPVPSAEVSADGTKALSDSRGVARLSLPEGQHAVTVTREGFETATQQVTIRAGQETSVQVQLREHALEESVTVVSATRSSTMLEDQPIRVEALPEEEIEENSTLAPGNLTTLLNEIGGLRVQTISPGLGGANMRLQGLPGRYTQFLTDELPLYGVEPDAFSLLQIPPLDLAQVEVIKGAASALYGGSALGGLVNLVSRRPGSEPEVLLSQTAHGGTDVVGFASGKMGGAWGFTILGGADWQQTRDLDGDGWADLPGYRRGVVRPRLFWDDGQGDSLFVTIGGTLEARQGGTVEGATTPEGVPFRERLDTRRLDGGLVGRFLVHGDRLISVHASYGSARHVHDLADERERDTRSSGSSEVSLSGNDRGHTWVLGAAIQHEQHRIEERSGFDGTSTAPGVFVQDEYAPNEHFGISGSARADFDDRYGSFFNPRLSALLRPGKTFTLRLSAGTGSSVPTPFLDETEVVGFSRVLPLGDPKAERARSTSIDASWSHGPFEVGETLFFSRVKDALQLRPDPTLADRFEIVNAPTATDAYGSQLFTRYKKGFLQIIVAHTYLRSTEADPEGTGRRETPLSPRNAGEIAVLWENEARGRLGVEIAYTGRQSLEHDPYRRTSVPYTVVSALGELRLKGESEIFVNATNLTGVRQTRFDPIFLPARSADGRFTTDVWAPLEGRSLNAGVRIDF